MAAVLAAAEPVACLRAGTGHQPQVERRAFSERGKEGKPRAGRPQKSAGGTTQLFPGQALLVEPRGDFSPGFFKTD